MKRFDFLEGYNSCESEESNQKAALLAQTYNLATFGGSDSHNLSCVGTAYTQIPEIITKESDLISCVKRRVPLTTGGSYYTGTVKQRIGILNHVLVESFWFYNRFASMARSHRRKVAMQLLP